VVTEYGVADLWGKSIRERAKALIEIAHPSFRGELLTAAKARRWALPDQIAPRGARPWAEAQTHRLPGGEEVLVRPVRISDETALQDLFYRLSDESTYMRFFAHKKAHPHEEMLALVDLDDEESVAIAAIVRTEDREEIVGMSRYDVDPATRLADVAFVVRDAWQGRGLGTLLMRRMTEIARARGLAGFTGDVLLANKRMMSLFYQSGLRVDAALREGTYHVVACFPAPSPA
jgi:GNAT superfamily N-acetyltransferase